MNILIKNGTLVDYTITENLDIYIEDGYVKQIGASIATSKDCITLDAAGLTIMPAFVDLHAHLRDPGFTYKEDLQSGCNAAVRGGFTTLNLMANTNPVCSSMDIAEDIVKRAAEIDLCDVRQCISFTKDFDGKTLDHLDKINDPEENIVKFISEDGFGIKDSLVFYNGLKKCAAIGRTLLIHADDPNFTPIDTAMAEELETLRDLYLAQKLGAKIHFCHVSTRYAAEIIIEAKKHNAPVTFEVTPHHLALTDAINFRVNPPLRSEIDRKFLIQCLKEGWVDAIATDHAPHSAEDKQKGTPGLTGFETAFSVCYTKLVKEEGLSLNMLSHLMSKRPAELMNLNKGALSPGVSGDVVIVDLNRKRKIDSNTFFSRGKNTPFDGHEYYGEIIYTVRAGKICYSERNEQGNDYR